MTPLIKLTLPPSTTYLHRSYGGRMSISPYQTPFKTYSISLRSRVVTCKPICVCVQENLFPKFHAIAPCDGDNNGNNWGNGGGGASGGGDGEGEGEGEEEGFEGNNELPMQHLNWRSDRQRKDQEPAWYLEVELKGLLGLKVQLDGFDEVDIFSGKNAAEEQKKKEKMLKEMEIAAYMAKATGANVRLVYLPRAVSISRPIEVNVAEIFYACADKLLQIIHAGPSYAFLRRLGVKLHNGEKLSAIFVTSSSQAKAIGANVRLSYLPGAVSLSPPIEVKAGSMGEIFYACSDKELQIVLAGRSYSSLRIDVKVRNGEKLSAIVASSRADVDGDGALKFVSVSFHPSKLANDELLKKVFAFFDPNKSGQIGLMEVVNATTLIVQHR